LLYGEFPILIIHILCFIGLDNFYNIINIWHFICVITTVGLDFQPKHVSHTRPLQKAAVKDKDYRGFAHDRADL
jgi:hypothetical protein